MKKLIIGAIIIAGCIGTGIVYFTNLSSNMTSKSNNVTKIQPTNKVLANTTTNIQNLSNNSISTNNNKNNQVSSSSNNQTSSTSNQTQNFETTNNNINTNNQSTFKMNLGNGNFNSLSGINFIYATVNNGAKLIITINSTVKNNQLQGTEYYLNRLNEKFNIKISSIGGNKYLIYEFYKGQHTGTFKMDGIGGGGQELGTYTHAKSNQTIGANFYYQTPGSSQGEMCTYPFYNGEVNGTPITWINDNTGTYIEFCKGDSNSFTLTTSFSHTGNYGLELLRMYNNQEMGEYYIKPTSNNNEYVVKYVKKSNGQSYNITLKGSMTPNI